MSQHGRGRLQAGGAAGEDGEMIVKESMPQFSDNNIPNFYRERPFEHQYKFYVNRGKDIILKSPTCSGKTDAFLIGFLNDYIEAKKHNKRIKCLYLAPTRLLMQSQFENITAQLNEFKINYKILESRYSFAELFKHLWENDFIISSPDIIFYILLRKRDTQHIIFQYNEFVRSLHSIVFDELHLFDTYTLFNVKNLIRIIKNIKKETRVYLLSATIELKDIINPSEFFVIDGVSKTKTVNVSAQELDYFDYKKVIHFLEDNNYLRDTIYVCNSVDRAIRLHNHFENSALLVGKTWYEENDTLSRDDLIKQNLEKCKNGTLTFTTSVFRQGVDISLKRLITEEPQNVQDTIQTFGRCGRHEESEFLMLTNRSPLIDELNSENAVTRIEFEELLSRHFRPQEYEQLKQMMNAMWFKLYSCTKLKQQVEFLLTEDMKVAYEEFKEFLPDLSFREPIPAVQYNDLTISLFEVLQFKDAYKNIFPSVDSFVIGELKDGGRFTRREYKKAKKIDLPTFTLIDSKRYKDTDYHNLTLKLGNTKFKVNAKIGPLGKYQHTFIDSKKLIPTQKSFEPAIFFE